MKPAVGKRVWRVTLVLGAAVALVAVLVIVLWVKGAATRTANDAARAPSSGQAKQESAPEPPAAVVPAPAPVNPVNPATPATSANAADAASGDDLSRLRSHGLALPLPAVRAAQLTDTFTQARAGGAAHEALDIMAPRGTPVLAVDDGRVVKLFLSKPGGITLYQFDPHDEYVYYYAHLDRYADGVTEGDSVRKGQIIGYVGSTGNALPDAPHLHFAILRLGPERQWWRGTAINPFLVWRNANP